MQRIVARADVAEVEMGRHPTVRQANRVVFWSERVQLLVLLLDDAVGQVHVGFDAARHDQSFLGGDDRLSLGRGARRRDQGDPAGLHTDTSDGAAVRGDDLAASDEQVEHSI